MSVEKKVKEHKNYKKLYCPTLKKNCIGSICVNWIQGFQSIAKERGVAIKETCIHYATITGTDDEWTVFKCSISGRELARKYLGETHW